MKTMLRYPMAYALRGCLGALCCILFLACSSIDCPVDNTVAVQYAVYDANGSATLTDTLWVLTRRSDGKDTIISRNSENSSVLLNCLFDASSFQLPVSYTNPEDTLFFIIHDSDNTWTLDSVFLKKENIPHFESVDCSAHFFHRLTGVRCTHNGIDSIKIENPTVDYDQTKTHLRIYFGGIMR